MGGSSLLNGSRLNIWERIRLGDVWREEIFLVRTKVYRRENLSIILASTAKTEFFREANEKSPTLSS